MIKAKDGDGTPQFNLSEENLESNFQKTREKISFFFYHGTFISIFNLLKMKKIWVNNLSS